jgi:hypothetical protein
LAEASVVLAGLDAVMGELICLLLERLATTWPKRIVFAAVHTPSSRSECLLPGRVFMVAPAKLDECHLGWGEFKMVK